LTTRKAEVGRLLGGGEGERGTLGDVGEDLSISGAIGPPRERVGSLRLFTKLQRRKGSPLNPTRKLPRLVILAGLLGCLAALAFSATASAATTTSSLSALAQL
jgi:hypothetical protein